MTNFMKPPRPPAKGCKSVSRFYQRLLFVIAILASEASVANCQLVLSQPRVDFGILRHAQWLDGPASSSSLGKRTVGLNVVCIDPVPMAIRFGGLPAGGRGFRFGGEGVVTLSIRHAQLDGRPVDLAVDGSTGDQLVPGQVLIARAAGVPVTGRRLSAQLEVDPYLPVDAFSVRRETTLEGQVQVEWVPHGAGISPAAPQNQ